MRAGGSGFRVGKMKQSGEYSLSSWKPLFSLYCTGFGTRQRFAEKDKEGQEKSQYIKSVIFTLCSFLFRRALFKLHREPGAGMALAGALLFTVGNLVLLVIRSKTRENEQLSDIS